MPLHLSRFYNRFDNEPKPVDIEWPALVEELLRFRIRATPDGELWSPARYKPGTARTLENVVELHLAVLDFDDGQTPEAFRDRWDELCLEYVIHSTYHNQIPKDKHPACVRWRAVFPLQAPCPADRWPRVYAQIAEYLAPGAWDPACKNPNRLFYLPASPDSKNTFSEHHPGRLLDIDDIPLMQAVPEHHEKQDKPEKHATTKDVQWVKEALPHVPADDYQTWISVGIVLKEAFGTDGRAIWDAWSRTSSKYPNNDEIMDTKWASFGANAGSEKPLAGLGSIHHLAVENGWEPLRHPAWDPDVPPLDDQDAPYIGPQVVPKLDEPTSKHEDETQPRLTAIAPATGSWRDSLAWTETENGRVLSRVPGNLALLLAHSEPWAACLGFCELSYRVTWLRPPPSMGGFVVPSGTLSDDHLVYIQHWHRLYGGLSLGLDAVAQAVASAARQHVYHPVRAYLERLRWDGVPRLDAWARTYLGAVECQTPIGAWWMISAVARVFRPGCQADHVLVMEGRQGVGKSSALRILGGEWYSGTLGDLRDKSAAESLAGYWIIEIGELDAIKGAGATRVKDFISKVDDNYRAPYARCAVSRPRQVVFAGTTNERHYLQDPTGARRFWPLHCAYVDRPGLERDRDQLWAEAVDGYQSGDPWWPTGEAVIERLTNETDQRQVPDTWEDLVQPYLAGQSGEITLADVFHRLDVPAAAQSPRECQRLASIMRRCGWRSRHTKAGNAWFRK